jgi:hypothetical protein
MLTSLEELTLGECLNQLLICCLLLLKSRIILLPFILILYFSQQSSLNYGSCFMINRNQMEIILQVPFQMRYNSCTIILQWVSACSSLSNPFLKYTTMLTYTFEYQIFEFCIKKLKLVCFVMAWATSKRMKQNTLMLGIFHALTYSMQIRIPLFPWMSVQH